jgi:rubredoxin
MAQIICPKCQHTFDNNTPESIVTRAAAAAALGATGAYYGSQVGIAGGPVGAINGAWIGGAVGGVTGWFIADQFRRCPKCGYIFKT